MLTRKGLIDVFPFISKTCQRTGNMRTGTEIVNPFIKNQSYF